jgi:peptidyl-dipeptidase Dcp
MKTIENLVAAGLVAALCSACAHSPSGGKAMSDPSTDGNPFFETWTTPFGVPPFDRIRDEHHGPAFEAGMEQKRREIRTIADDPAPPTFENTLAALDRSGALLQKVSLVFFSLQAADTNERLDQIAQEVAPRLSRLQDDILLDAKLFARIRTVHQERKSLPLDEEQRTLLEETYLDFTLGGAELAADKQAELRAVNERLATLKVQFGQNLRKENNAFELWLESEADLAGLPEAVRASGAKAAAERGQPDRWLFSLHKPSLIPFLQYSALRPLRERMFRAYVERGSHAGPLDNREVLKEIVALRIRKAGLLGRPTFAALQLERRMAREPRAVHELLDRLWQAALPVARREAAALQALIDREGGGFPLEPWDWWYYTEKLRKSEFDLDENELRLYFQLERVLQGAFEVASRLYGLRFLARADLPSYHPEARAFEVQESDGSHLGVLYVDYFPRASKRGGAWCGGFRQQIRLDGKRISPLVTNVGNFTRPTADQPSLLSFEEVTTLFHEFGHALHALLANTTYAATGENVKVDFVELPSQIMENWASEPEVLRLYARHHQTGAVIPDALIEKLHKNRHFNQGFETVEYLAASFLDLAWHGLEWVQELDAGTFEAQTLQRIGLIPQIFSRYQSPNFQHIFASDFYAAGYYSYIWSAVLDADAFEAFRAKGLFDQDTARAFRRHVLERGGAEDPMRLYQRFRGAPPRVEPLLSRRGLAPEVPEPAEAR